MTYIRGRRVEQLVLLSLVIVFLSLLLNDRAYGLTTLGYRDRINLANAQYNGAGTVIGIFDSGINVDSESFKTNGVSRIVSQYCVGNSSQVNPCDTRRDHLAHNMCNSSKPGCYHGMAVAGFAASNVSRVVLGGKNVEVGGIAPQASISYVRVAMDNDGLIEYDDFIAGLQKFVNDVKTHSPSAPDVVNLSLGFPRSDFADCDKDNEAKRLIDLLVDSGVIVVAASGNNSDKSQISYPACMSNVIAVGSSSFNQHESVSSFSNMSTDIDIVAPGQKQWGLAPQDMHYISVSGTSFAAPIVSGAIALLKQQNPKLNFNQVRDILRATGNEVVDEKTGLTYRELNVDNALNSPVQTTPVNESNKKYVVDSTQPKATPLNVGYEVKSHSQKLYNQNYDGKGHVRENSYTRRWLTAILLSLLVVSTLLRVVKRYSGSCDDQSDVNLTIEDLNDFDHWEIDLLTSDIKDRV